MTSHAILLRPPAEVAPIVAVIGADATLRLVEQLGGVRVKLSNKAGPTSMLVLAIGSDAQQKLAREFGAGSSLNVPLCKPWRVKVLRLRDGLSYSDIARELGMVESTVYRYLNAAGLTDVQGRLLGL